MRVIPGLEIPQSIEGERKTDTFLWILQWLLAGTFLMAGVMKLMQPKEKLAESMGWANDFRSNTIKEIGMAEVLAAVGLVVPPSPTSPRSRCCSNA